MRPLGGILGPLGGILVPLGPSWRRLGGVVELQNPPHPRRPGRGGGSAAATPGRIPLGLLGSAAPGLVPAHGVWSPLF